MSIKKGFEMNSDEVAPNVLHPFANGIPENYDPPEDKIVLKYGGSEFEITRKHYPDGSVWWNIEGAKCSFSADSYKEIASAIRWYFEAYPTPSPDYRAARGILATLPDKELGVIEDMESTLLPDNHTVKGRGVWLMDGERKTLFLESGIVSDLQHELSCLRDAIRELSNVGNIFDGCDHCDEFTHETNAKLMEHTLDKIYAIVTAPLPVNYDEIL